MTAGAIDITPTAPVPLAGYGGRTEPFVDVAQPLEAGAIVLRQGDLLVAVVTLDSLYTCEALRDAILAACPELDEARLWLGASHTHFAPGLDESKPLVGAVDPAYKALVFERVAGLLRRLIDEEPFTAQRWWHVGEARQAINRRRRGWDVSRRGIARGTILAPNEEGPREDRLRAARFVDEAGETRAILWTATCHPVSSPGRLRVNSDFPGWTRRRLRLEYRPDLPVLFLQGLTGDIRPRTIRPWRHVLKRQIGLHGRVNLLLNRSIFGGFGDRAFMAWAKGFADALIVALKEGELLRPALRAEALSLPIGAVVEGSASTDRLLLRSLHLSDDLVFVALSAEAVVAYGAHVERAFAPARAVPIGYTDHVFGYLPTEAMLEEGGYEAQGFVRWFEMDGGIRPGAEAATRDALQALAARSSGR